MSSSWKRIIALILAVVVFCGAIVAIFKVTDTFDNLLSKKDKIETTEEEKGDELDDKIQNEDDLGEAVTVFNKGDDTLSYFWIPAETGDYVMYGMTIDENSSYKLKANTKYRISWSINSAYKIGTPAWIDLRFIKGAYAYCFFLNTNYVEGGTLGERIYGRSEGIMMNNSWEFETGDTVGQFAFTMFRYDVNTNDVNSITSVGKNLLDNYLIQFTLEELEV